MSMDPILSIPVAFLAGLAGFASPCFLPIVPVFLSSLLGTATREFPQLTSSRGSNGFIDYRQGSGDQTQPAATLSVPTDASVLSARVGAIQALCFVAAFSAVFIGIWTLVALFGWLAADWLRLLLPVAGGVLIVMGLTQVGALRFAPWERFTSKSASWSHRIGGKPGIRRSLLMGLAFGLGWSPCIGPTLGAIITLALTSGSLAAGTWLLLVFCLGLGTPLVILSLGVGRFSGGLRWLRRGSRTIKMITGGLLIVVGLLMVTGLFAQVSSISWISL